MLADQADFSAAATMRTKTEKGRYVYDSLRNKSQATQGPILRWLSQRGLEHRSFYIVNAVLVKGTREVAEALAARPDVARIEGNPHVHIDLPQPVPAAEAPSQPRIPETIEPGINYTHAPQVWGLGFTGQGIVVASSDTGVRWTHNALKPHYRGWDGTMADHDYNWHDAVHDSIGNPCGNDSPEPCDDNGHGSHTTGTMIGDDGAGNQIGMAPGAKWIGCRFIDSVRVSAHMPAPSSAWNFSWRLTRWVAIQARATRPKRLTSLTIPGAVILRKNVLMALCKLLLKPNAQLAS